MGLGPTITNSYSMDIIIKICGTLTTFIIFIFVSAWHLTRRNYKFPHFIREEYLIKNVKDLLNSRFLNICYKESKDNFNCGVIAAPAFDDKMAVIINDINWCLRDKPNPIISVPFSLMPKSIKQKWNGIIFSHDSSEADVLRCLVVKGFESIDWCVLEKSINFGLRFSDDNEIHVGLSAQLIAFESIMGYTVDMDNLEKKIIFVSKIVEAITEFSDYFYCGKLPNDEPPSTSSQYTENVTKLLQPVVESAIYHSDSQYSNTELVNVVSENVLSQISKLRHHLREENASCNLLTVGNFCHVLFEHYFILNELLTKCLRGIRHLSAVGSDVVGVVRNELIKEASFANGTQLKLFEFHLEASTSLVYTKAVAQELLRLLAIGVDFDLQMTERDGLIGGFDLKEKSVIVLNHFAFTRSKCYHVTNSADAELFRASRFIKYDPADQKYIFFNSDKLVAFQDQWHVVGLPRNFICRLMLLLLVKVACPDFALDMKNSVKETAAIPQYELLYDLEKQFVWNWEDLVDD